MAKKVNEKRKCPTCNRELVRTSSNFYKSNNPKYEKNDGYCDVCKGCLREMCFNKDGSVNIDNLHIVLEMLDKPFIKEEYIKVSSKGAFDLGMYLKNVSFNKYHSYTYKDSDGYDRNEEVIKNNEKISNKNINETISDFQVTPEIINFWGKGYNVEQYEQLTNFYDEFASEYETDLPAQRLNFKNAAKTQLQADEALLTGNLTLYNQLMKTLSSILGDSNVKPVQATGAEANDQITFGVLIKKYENERPIPETIDDEMKKCIELYMVGHLAKMEGINNEFVDMYNESMKEYSVDFTGLHNDEEDE